MWICSSDKRAHDAESRRQRIEKAPAALEALDTDLGSVRCRLTSQPAVEAAVTAILKETQAVRWVTVAVLDTISYQHRQESRGRPGANTRYRRIERHRYSLEIRTDAEAVAYDAASDGCFPFITNEKLPASELLRIYKDQPHLERRHATFKGVIEAAPPTLKSDARIDALALCLYVALLVHALLERELRHAMAAKGIAALPRYYEDRRCTSPTAARVFELLDSLSATTVTHDGNLLAVVPPTLDPLQRQILGLVKVPRSAYGLR